MKRVVCIICTLMLFVNIIPVLGSATERGSDIITFEDGSYILISVAEQGIRATSSKSGTKTYTYYDSTGVMKWKAVLSGTFAYNGYSATCALSSCDVTIYDSDWYVVSKSAGKTGSSATGKVTMGYKVLGSTVDTYAVNLVLTCDVNGNLS